MAKEETLLFVLFLSIAGICFYKWLLLHLKIKIMELISAKCTDVITRTMYHKTTHEYHYDYIYNNEEYKTSDRLKYKFILFSPKINDEVEMYVNKKNPNITVSPWNTFLYKFYFNLIIICILIPFIIYNLK